MRWFPVILSQPFLQSSQYSPFLSSSDYGCWYHSIKEPADKVQLAILKKLTALLTNFVLFHALLNDSRIIIPAFKYFSAR